MPSIFKILKLMLDVGYPPDLKDEEAFRAWMIDIADAASTLAMLTGTELDNRVAAVLDVIVDDDKYWTVLYAILLKAAQYITLEEQDVAASSDDGLGMLCQQTAIDPATLIAIITAILNMVDWWRNRKK